MPLPVPILVNASAGTGEACDALGERLREAGLEPRLVRLPPGGDLSELAAGAAREKPPVIVAAGGDGTASAVASALVGTDIALGVLPIGTLNHFAKDLGIPLDIAEAARTIAAGHAVAVDVGEVNGRVFINNSSLGLYPHIVRDREQQQRRLGRGKWPALFWATLAVLRRSPFLSVRVCLGEEKQECRTGFVFIGNNEYVMEGFNIGSRERLDGGRLSLYLTRRRSRARLFMLGVRALIGRLKQADDFDALGAQTITIESRHARLHVATDGEVAVMEPPLEYRIRPRALRVIVPRTEARQA